MSIEHKNIVDPDIHEPKGAATAAAGTVYVANGAGGGVWTIPPASLFGDMDFFGNTVATTITTASPTRGDGNAVLLTGGTLVTPGVLFTQGVIDTIAYENVANNELLRVPSAGIYEISFALSFSGGGGGAGNVYRFSFAINGLEITNHAAIRRQTGSSDVGAVAMSEYIQLAANDTVQVSVANESGVNDPTISSATMTIVLLKAL